MKNDMVWYGTVWYYIVMHDGTWHGMVLLSGTLLAGSGMVLLFLLCDGV